MVKSKHSDLHVVRNEIKYMLSKQEAWLARQRLSQAVARDPYSREGGYFIRSLYFDNVANSSYFDRVEGFENRRKYRVRLYEFNAKEIKFEVKFKYNDSMKKESAWMPVSYLKRLEAGDIECLLSHGSAVLKQVYYAFKRDRFRPVVIVDYRRDAFFMDVQDLRITFDTDLRKSSRVADTLKPDADTLPVLEKYHTILEIKYNKFFPSWLEGLLGLRRFQRCARSKYCMARMI